MGRASPSSSSQSAGSAALARFEAQERRGQPSRPLEGRVARGRSLGNTSPSTSGGPMATAGEAGGGVVKKKTCSQAPQREDPAPVEVWNICTIYTVEPIYNRTSDA